MGNSTSWYKSNEFKISLAILIIGGLGTIIYDQVTSATIFSTLVSILRWCWNSIVFILTYPVKVYWIILAIIGLIVVIYIASLFDKKQSKYPEFLSYTSDTLKRWKWAWQYRLTNSGYKIENLIPYCSTCGYPMKYGKSYWNDINAECPKCKKWISDQEKEDSTDIEIMIEHKIRTNNFPGANGGLA